METSTEQIKDISVEIVKNFIDHKISLSDGIAKVASEMELNPDQIKRVVETCNTVTYLTLQKQAEERDFEFKVADYNGVMAAMTIPSKIDGTVTEAEFKEAQEKQASEQYSYEPDEQTLRAWTTKEWLKNKDMLDKLAYDQAACLMNIGDLAVSFKKDEYALEKLAEITDEITYIKLATLIGANPKTALRSHIFKEAELTDARKLVELIKEAQALVKETEERQGLEKRAVVAAAIGGVAKAMGSAAGFAGAAAAKGLGKGVSGLSKRKIIHPLDVGMAALTEPKPAQNIWDNLQGSKKRF